MTVYADDKNCSLPAKNATAIITTMKKQEAIKQFKKLCSTNEIVWAKSIKCFPVEPGSKLKRGCYSFGHERTCTGGKPNYQLGYLWQTAIGLMEVVEQEGRSYEECLAAIEKRK